LFDSVSALTNDVRGDVRGDVKGREMFILIVCLIVLQ
jgi:hypothetical protein